MARRCDNRKHVVARLAEKRRSFAGEITQRKAFWLHLLHRVSPSLCPFSHIILYSIPSYYRALTFDRTYRAAFIVRRS
jgi:hypothetical protein